VKGFVDFDKQKSGVLAKIFGIKVFRLEGAINENEQGLIVFNRTSKKKYKYKANKKGLKGIIAGFKRLDLSIIKNLNIRRISFELKYGSNEAAKTVYILSFIRIIFYSIFSFFVSKQKIDLHEKIIPDFDNKSFSLRVYGIFSLSIGDIIYGFCVWIFKRKMRKKRFVLKRKPALNKRYIIRRKAR